MGDRRRRSTHWKNASDQNVEIAVARPIETFILGLAFPAAERKERVSCASVIFFS
jgi:hypothetical protein